MTNLANNSRSFVEQHGRSVDHHYYERLESDGREGWPEASNSPDTIPAIPDTSGTSPMFNRDTREASVATRRVYHVPSDVDTDFRDGGGDGASQIEDDGSRWVVMDKDTLGNGLYRLITRRRD